MWIINGAGISNEAAICNGAGSNNGALISNGQATTMKQVATMGQAAAMKQATTDDGVGQRSAMKPQWAVEQTIAMEQQ